MEDADRFVPHNQQYGFCWLDDARNHGYNYDRNLVIQQYSSFSKRMVRSKNILLLKRSNTVNQTSICKPEIATFVSNILLYKQACNCLYLSHEGLNKMEVVYKIIFVDGSVWIVIETSPTFVGMDSIDNKLISTDLDNKQQAGWNNKLITHKCASRLEWVNEGLYFYVI